MQSFEKSINRLNEIVKQLQSGELSLDESLKVFEEGAELIGTCSSILDKAEQKVSKLSATGEKEEFTDES